MATKKTVIVPAKSKKELKKELAGKMESVFAELKNTLGEKEFQHRVKKASKVLTHGLHSKEIPASNNGAPSVPKKTAPKKIKSLKKAKANPKKATV